MGRGRLVLVLVTAAVAAGDAVPNPLSAGGGSFAVAYREPATAASVPAAPAF